MGSRKGAYWNGVRSSSSFNQLKMENRAHKRTQFRFGKKKIWFLLHWIMRGCMWKGYWKGFLFNNIPVTFNVIFWFYFITIESKFFENCLIFEEKILFFKFKALYIANSINFHILNKNRLIINLSSAFSP